MIFDVELLLRIVIAGLCGILIGFERKNRFKVAGIKTHMIVCLASALMMIISKYGFADVASHDSSRIAAQIVSGVGFLGAGMIFVKNQNVQGLTTAAGIWATAGIGMAIGAGMYIIGLASAILILIFQLGAHFLEDLLRTKGIQQSYRLEGEDNPYSTQQLLDLCKHQNMEFCRLDRSDSGRVVLEVTINFGTAKQESDWLQHVTQQEFVKKIEWF